jgi:hypothetical protein
MGEVSDLGLALLLVAAVMNGLLAGVSLNKSVVELPAGRRIGSLAFASFSRAADLGNGLPYYAALGLMTPAISVAAAVEIVVGAAPSMALLILAVAVACLSIAHVGATVGAAPNMHRIGRLGNDAEALDGAYGRFRVWHDARAILQVLTFGLVVTVIGVLA